IQYRLDKGSYQYFENMQRNMDESGSLFAPQPSEMTGNIQCLSDPEEPVIGYVVASKETTSRLFIPMAEMNLNFYDDIQGYPCEQRVIDDLMQGLMQGYAHIGSTELGENLFVSGICADCTRRGLGAPSKTKPDYWPNDHK
ncbi:MAG: DUF4249 domain-containing protein, partial [Tannerella sp.]|nr:DUF4249 domain-containing protein [Tannerella sp.]